jgi:hypothetical protein
MVESLLSFSQLARPDFVRISCHTGSKLPSQQERCHYLTLMASYRLKIKRSTTETSPDAPETLVQKRSTRMISIWRTEPKLEQRRFSSRLNALYWLWQAMTMSLLIPTPSSSSRIFHWGQLAILPGTSHGLVKEKPALVQLLIREFLEDLSYPVTRMPIRRTNPSVN